MGEREGGEGRGRKGRRERGEGESEGETRRERREGRRGAGGKEERGKGAREGGEDITIIALFAVNVNRRTSFLDAAQQEKMRERENLESGLMFSRDRLIEMIPVI